MTSLRPAPANFFYVWAAGVVGLMAAVGHELLYRRTGGGDFELSGTISHAGVDMLVVTVTIVLVLALIEWARAR